MKKILFVLASMGMAGAFAATTTFASTGPVQITGNADAQEIVMDAPAAVRKCKGCHGGEALTGKRKAPNIAGTAKATLMSSMGHGIASDDVEANLRTKENPDGKIPKQMKRVAKSLSDAQKRALANYISGCPTSGCPTTEAE